jgi:hypothetical protein
MIRRLPVFLMFLVPALVAAYTGPDTCAECHPDEHAAWKGSVHSRALSDTFQKAWNDGGKPSACLACHTTGLKKGTRSYAFAGVTCESCHGPMSEGHPGEKMPLPVDAKMCAGCHVRTQQEWALSAHGGKNIRCFDCHVAHGQGLRAGGGDALCGSCHAAKQKDFAHATHHQEGLHCATCHLPAPKSKADVIQGTGASAHTLAVGAEVCARCHEDTVHTSARLADLREKVSSVQKQMSVAGVSSVFDLQEKNQDLEWRLDRARQSAWLTLILGGLAGLGLGWLAAWLFFRRSGGR